MKSVKSNHKAQSLVEYFFFELLIKKETDLTQLTLLQIRHNGAYISLKKFYLKGTLNRIL